MEKEDSRIARYVECNKIGDGDCLSKTQDYAKLKDEVYGLKPAQCPKVNKRRFTFSL